jgi:hypothetical protein
MFEEAILLRASRLRRHDGNWLAGNWLRVAVTVNE